MFYKHEESADSMTTFPDDQLGASHPMTPTPADPGAIDLEPYKAYRGRLPTEKVDKLIAAVEALRERVAKLERLDAGTYLHEIEHFIERTEAAEARVAELAGALGKILPVLDRTTITGEIRRAHVEVKRLVEAALAATPAEAMERTENELEASLKDALMAGIQTGVGETFHPDAKALICIAFKSGADAERFHVAYIEVRAKLDALGKEEGP